MSKGSRTRVRIGIVAGEVSGDLLGAALIRELKKIVPGARFEGVAGPHMQDEGCVSLYPMEMLSVVGFGVVSRLPALLRMRRKLVQHFRRHQFDLFIGIDAPDFNIGLEERLKAAGIRTVQYVSPQVWAWRRWRIRTIHRAVDHMLTLFPFEAKFYRGERVPVTFVGHPITQRIPARYSVATYRRQLGIPIGKKVLALLPGSRHGELTRHSGLFVETALWLHARYPELRFVAAFTNVRARARFEREMLKQGAEKLPVTLLVGKAREAMAAADAVLLASGTATLEAGLLCKPMVVTYRVGWLSSQLVRLMAHIRDFALPNIILGRRVVPEFLQEQAVTERIGPALEGYLFRPAKARRVARVLSGIRRQLGRNASQRAAAAVARLIQEHK